MTAASTAAFLADPDPDHGASEKMDGAFWRRKEIALRTASERTQTVHGVCAKAHTMGRMVFEAGPFASLEPHEVAFAGSVADDVARLVGPHD